MSIMLFAKCANMYDQVYSVRSKIVCSPSQKKLTTLDIAANRVKKIENISHLTELQEFWVWILCEVETKCFTFYYDKLFYYNVVAIVVT